MFSRHKPYSNWASDFAAVTDAVGIFVVRIALAAALVLLAERSDGLQLERLFSLQLFG